MKAITRQFGYWLVLGSVWAGSAWLLLPEQVQAVSKYQLPVDTPADGQTYKFSNLVNQIITVVLFIVGVAAILYLLISGVQYITAGGDDEKAGKARKGIINAIIGLIIVMASWFILRSAVGAGKNIGDEALFQDAL